MTGVPTRFDAQWLRTLSLTVTWVAEHGQLPGVDGALDGEDQAGRWLLQQKRHARDGTLTASRTTILNHAIPGWDQPRRRTWDESLSLLREWVAAHPGQMPRKRGHAGTEEIRLGQWLDMQRQDMRTNHPRSTAARRAALDAAVPGWGTPPRGTRAHRPPQEDTP